MQIGNRLRGLGCFMAFLLLAGCESDLGLSRQALLSTRTDSNPGSQGEGNKGGGGKGPGNIDSDQDINDDNGDYDEGEDGDDDSCDLYGHKGRTFYRAFDVGPVKGEFKLSLAASPERCIYDKKLEVPPQVLSRSRQVSLDKCNGFRNAALVYAKNGACQAKEIVIRKYSFGNLVSDYRALGISADCVCYYVREHSVADQIHSIRKRFAATDICAQNFEPWGNYSGLIPAPDPSSGG